MKNNQPINIEVDLFASASAKEIKALDEDIKTFVEDRHGLPFLYFDILKYLKEQKHRVNLINQHVNKYFTVTASINKKQSK